MYNPLTESPLNLWQTLNTQNIPKLKVILIKAEGIKFWFATRAQHIIWAAKIHLTTESDQFSMENLAKKKKTHKTGGGTFQKQVCLGLTTADNWRRQWHPTPVFLPGKSHGQRSLVGCSPWVTENQTRLSDFTFTFHFHSLEKAMATHSSILA